MLYAIKPSLYNFSKVNYGSKDLNYMNNSSYFIKLFYHTSFVSMYGVFISLPFKNVVTIPSYNFSKVSFNVVLNESIISFIENIENQLLEPIKKTKKLLLSTELRSGIIKVNEKNKQNKKEIIVKIIGIWESQYKCGLKYKFIFN